MKSPLAQNTAKSAKDLAKQIARQIAQEPLEILKNAGDQVTGKETPTPIENHPSFQESDDQKKLVGHQNEIADKLKSGRRMEALNRELTDMQKQSLFKDLQRRISSGEEVPIEDYEGLSMEQKQVLRAQMEAFKQQKAISEKQQGGLIEPAAKKGRQLFNFGKKTAVQREQTHVEKPVPPSG